MVVLVTVAISMVELTMLNDVAPAVEDYVDIVVIGDVDDNDDDNDDDNYVDDDTVDDGDDGL